MAKGFNRGPAMGGQSGMMQQLQQMQKKMEIAQARRRTGLRGVTKFGDGTRATAGKSGWRCGRYGEVFAVSLTSSPCIKAVHFMHG